MNFTKTELQIITDLLRTKSLCRVCSEDSVGRGPSGGRIVYGAKRARALKSLIRKGILSLVEKYSHTLYEAGYGVTTYVTVATWASVK